MHFWQFFIQSSRFLLRFLDLLLPLLHFLTYLLQLALVLQGVQRTPAFLHDLSETRVGYQSGDHIASIAQVLDAFYIALHLGLELFYLVLVLSCQFFDSFIEIAILPFFFFRKFFVLVQQFDLFFKYVFVVSSYGVQYCVLSWVFLDNFSIHVSEVDLWLFDELGNFSMQATGVLLRLYVCNTLFELRVFVPELFDSGLAHSNNIQIKTTIGCSRLIINRL